MNIWGALLILTILLWLFYEYTLYISKKTKGILKDYLELKKMERKFAEEIKKTLIENWEEEFEDTLLIQDDGHMELTTNCLELLLTHFLEIIEKPSYLKNCRKLKVKIKARKGAILIEKINPIEKGTLRAGHKGIMLTEDEFNSENIKEILEEKKNENK